MILKHLLLSRTILDHPDVYQLLSTHLTRQDKVLIILYSFFDSWFPTEAHYHDYYDEKGDYVQKMKRQLSLYHVDHVEFLNYYKETNESRTKKLHEATVLYFPGGAPDQMMKRLNQHQLIQPLKAFKGLTIGSSAGAMIHFKKPHLYKDDDYEKFQYIQGLGYIDGFDISVHYRRRNQQDKAIRRVVHERHIDVYAIPDDGAIFIHNNNIKLLGSAKKIMNKKGQFL